MGKYNRAGLKTRNTATSPVKTSPVADTRTALGAAAFSRDFKSELWLLGMNNMTSETSFHESAEFRDGRFTRLVTQAACDDPQWCAGFLPWLRTVANMRSAPLTGAVDAVRAMRDAKIHGGRSIINAVMTRADQPGEALGYHAATYGRQFPAALKAGCALAAARLYTERSTVRWDTASHAYRFGRVVQLCHPKASGPQQSALFKLLIDRSYDRADLNYGGLRMLASDAALRIVAEEDPRVVADTDRLRQAGWVFQDALPYAGAAVSKRELWEAVIPLMYYEALLNNLAVFDRCEVSDEVCETVAAKLADPEQVRRSQVFPFKFLAAYEQIPSLRWGNALEKGLRACVSAVPQLAGRTLVLVDTSASMTNVTLSQKSKMTAAKAAAVFGVALAAGQRGGADLYGFAGGYGTVKTVFPHPVGKGASLLKEISAFLGRTGEAGHGTDITTALRQTYRAHDRVIIITDEQSCSRYDMSTVPAHVPLYVFNLSGYSAGYMPAGPNRHSLGGLTDATFKMIPVLERGISVSWPWESAADS